MSRYYNNNISKEDFLAKIKSSFFGKEGVSKVVYKDLDKVEFGWENCDKVDDFGENGYVEIEPGFHTQIIFAGDDSEMPVHFAVYWDGTQLRAYIPKDGNPWDKKEKIAWDYDIWSEEEKENDPMDYNLMVKDISNRIKLKP